MKVRRLIITLFKVAFAKELAFLYTDLSLVESVRHLIVIMWDAITILDRIVQAHTFVRD